MEVVGGNLAWYFCTTPYLGHTSSSCIACFQNPVETLLSARLKKSEVDLKVRRDTMHLTNR